MNALNLAEICLSLLIDKIKYLDQTYLQAIIG